MVRFSVYKDHIWAMVKPCYSKLFYEKICSIYFVSLSKRDLAMSLMEKNINSEIPKIIADASLKNICGVSWPSGLAYRTQVLVLAAECGFESRP